MKFTREAWENAPEGATLEHGGFPWEPVEFIGFTKANAPVIEDHGQVRVTHNNRLRIVLPKRKIMVQLWRRIDGKLFTSTPETLTHVPCDWTLLGEHTFEIEGE